MEKTTDSFLLTQEKRTILMLQACEVVRDVARHVLAMGEKPQSIYNTLEVAKHQFTTLDAEGASQLRASIEHRMPEFHGMVLEESEIPRALGAGSVCFPLLIADAVEGSTNAKRGLSALIRRPVLAGSSVAILEAETLGSIAASAFFDYSTGNVFSSVRTGQGEFLSFFNGQLLHPRTPEILSIRGDSQQYVVVPGYSHDNVEARAEIERVLLDAGFRTTGGTRSSAQDLLDILGSQVDAYVDLRSHFPGSTTSQDEVLHVWDVGGLLPVLEGLGFIITDARGQGWQKCRLGEKLALVVSRPNISQRVLEAVNRLSFLEGDEAGAETIRMTHPV